MANPVYAPTANSTNGYYTGEYVGSVVQDAIEVTMEHSVEQGSVHMGTILNDATVGSMPGVGVRLVQTLTGCTSSVKDMIVAKSAELKITYAASTGYTLPTAVTVKVGGVTKTVTTDYTFASGVLTIPAAKVTGDVEVTVTATDAG